MPKEIELNQQLKIALAEIGTIAPWWSDEDDMYVFEHPAYPRVLYADPDLEQAKQGYTRALTRFIEYRLSGDLAPEAEKATTGRGGYRPGAGRPKKPTTTQVRIPDDILDVVHWLRQDPDRAAQVRSRFMEA